MTVRTIAAALALALVAPALFTASEARTARITAQRTAAAKSAESSGSTRTESTESGSTCQSTPEEAARSRFRSLRRTAHKGPSNDQLELAKMYRQGIGVKQSTEQALIWYTRAAENGHPLAQAFLAYFYLTGEGVPKNYTIGASWLRQAERRQYTDPEFLRMPPEFQSQARNLIRDMYFIEIKAQFDPEAGSATVKKGGRRKEPTP